jgi:hypothetical protein
VFPRFLNDLPDYLVVLVPLFDNDLAGLCANFEVVSARHFSLNRSTRRLILEGLLRQLGALCDRGLWHFDLWRLGDLMHLFMHCWLCLHHLKGETFREHVRLHDSHELLLRQPLPLSLRDILPHLIFVALLNH